MRKAGANHTDVAFFFCCVILGVLVAGSALTGRAAVPVTADLYLKVTIVTGERSRDSNSTTRTLTVSSGELTYKETYQGAHSNQRRPVSKQFQLTREDQETLIALLKARNLLVTKTTSKPAMQKGSSRYFELAITSALAGKENSVAIEASPSASALKTDPLYQGSLSLIEQLYQIMNRTDPDLAIPTLID